MKFFLPILTLTLIQSQSWAGDKARNGGSIIQCGARAEVYDLFEGREAHGLNISNFSGDELSIVKAVLKRIEKFEPRRAAKYSNYLESFYSEARFVNAPISAIEDLGEGTLLPPKGCTKVQAISQARKTSLVEARYLISEKIWKSLDSLNRAALIVHELIYREVFEENEIVSNSQGVRNLSALLFSNEFERLNWESYILAIKGSGLQSVQYKGYTLLLHAGRNRISDRPSYYPIKFFNDGTVKEASLGREARLAQSSPSIKCSLATGLINPRNYIAVSFEGDESVLKATCPMIVREKNWEVLANYISIDAKGKIAQVGFISSEVFSSKTLRSISFVEAGWSIEGYRVDGFLSFHSNGYLKALVVNGSASQRIDIQNSQSSISLDMNKTLQIDFDEQGDLRQWSLF